MSKLSKFLGRDKNKAKQNQAKLDILAPEYQKRLDALNLEFGVMLNASLEITPAGIIPKVKIVLAEDVIKNLPPQAIQQVPNVPKP